MRVFSYPRMIAIRLFNVNVPGAEVVALKGRVAGRSILMGVRRLEMAKIWLGEWGRRDEGQHGAESVPADPSRIVLFRAETKQVRVAVPGGLIGVETKIDPMLCHAARLCGRPPADINWCAPTPYSSRASWAQCC